MHELSPPSSTGLLEAELALSAEDWDQQQEPGGAAAALGMPFFQEAPTASVAAPSKHAPFHPPTLISGPNFPPPVPGGAGSGPPTSQGELLPGSGVPMEWAQLQVQMQLLSQQNPAFFQQMQQFFWSQTMASQQIQMQHIQQLQAQGYLHHQHHQHHQQPPQPGVGGGGGGREMESGTAPTTNYYAAAPPPPALLPQPVTMDQKGGGSGGGTQYMQTAPSSGGLFIPPMTHVPPPDEPSTNQSQTPITRRSLAIPIVPPKVHYNTSLHTLIVIFVIVGQVLLYYY